MSLFGSIQTIMPHLQFAPPQGPQQLGPDAYITPQDKWLADKARRGDLAQQTMNSLQGNPNVQNPSAPGVPAGGVPGAGGGGAPPPSAGIQSMMGNAGQKYGGGGASSALMGGGQGGGLMNAILKALPMLMGG